MAALRPVERRYVNALRGVARAYAAAYMKKLGPQLEEVATREDAKAPLSGVLDVLGMQIQTAIAAVVGPIFDRHARDVLRANARGMRLLGIELGGISGNPGVVTNAERDGFQKDIAAARERNILLVENAHRVYAKQVRELVEDPQNFGLRVEELKAKLLERADVTESRAELIARDQTLKLNGQIAATRQQRAGVEEYVWSTSLDERVRDTHAALEGQRFAWTNPPEVGHPGQDFQCRCVAIPVGIEELDDVFGDGT